jgi:sulfane dehydrogenase subunit SoxC
VKDTSLTRRNAIKGVAAASAAIVSSKVAALAQGIPQGAAAPSAPVVPDDPTKVPGHIPTDLGSRSPFESPRRRVNRAAPSGESETPLHELTGIITPADLHFERHHGGVPSIDPARYQLLIHGMVDRPLKFTLADLKRFPSVTQIHFIECSGNGSRAYHATAMKPDATPQWIDGLVSTSEWTGVPLATLFREAGIHPAAKWFLAEGMDSARMTRSIPVEKAMDDAMIAYAQNGEAIRPEQGYPARLLLPGWEGNSNVKWIRRLELSDRPFYTKEETAKYSDPLGNGTARMFSFVMDAKSTITFPTFPRQITPGWWDISGLAWSGRGQITHVNVSTNGGGTWQDAELQEPVLSQAQTRFRFPWRWRGEEAVLMSRAVDETGYVQPTRAELVSVRGAGTMYHFNNIRAWKVQRDGRVFFQPEA